MKAVRVLFLIAFGVLFSACTTFPTFPTFFTSEKENVCVTRRVSSDYIMTGTIDNMRAYVYGNRTILEFDGNSSASSSSLLVTDEIGAFVSYEKIGQLYRLARRLDNFNVRVNEQSANFVSITPVMNVATPVKTPVEVAQPTIAAAKPTPVKPVASKPMENDAVVISQLLALSEKQLQAMRQTNEMINKKGRQSHQLHQVQQSKTKKSHHLKNSNNLNKINNLNNFNNFNNLSLRANKMETRFVTASSANIQVYFEPASILFKPSSEVSKVLLASARIAQQIVVRGYTDADSSSRGQVNTKVSLSRALEARQFLISHGIPSEKIKVFAQANGDVAVSNLTPEGKAYNRRVEIELVHPLIAELKSKKQVNKAPTRK